MIEKTDVSLNRCYNCKSPLKNGDVVIVLSEGLFDDHEIKDNLAIIDNPNYGSYLSVPKKIYFHKECHTNLAGEDYNFE